MDEPLNLSFASLATDYAAGRRMPAGVIDAVLARAAQMEDANIWITRLTRAEIEPYLQSLVARTGRIQQYRRSQAYPRRDQHRRRRAGLSHPGLCEHFHAYRRRCAARAGCGRRVRSQRPLRPADGRGQPDRDAPFSLRRAGPGRTGFRRRYRCGPAFHRNRRHTGIARWHWRAD